MRKTLPRVLAVIVVFLLLAWGAVYLVSSTDWGRERVRRKLVALIQGNSHGIVKIGSVSGNLLHGFTAHDLSITDSANHPFIKVDSLTASYGIRTLFGKKIDFSQVQLFRPVVVIDKQPGGKWNYDIIFPPGHRHQGGREKNRLGNVDPLQRRDDSRGRSYRPHPVGDRHSHRRRRAH